MRLSFNSSSGYFNLKIEKKDVLCKMPQEQCCLKSTKTDIDNNYLDGIIFPSLLYL